MAKKASSASSAAKKAWETRRRNQGGGGAKSAASSAPKAPKKPTLRNPTSGSLSTSKPPKKPSSDAGKLTLAGYKSLSGREQSVLNRIFARGDATRRAYRRSLGFR